MNDFETFGMIRNLVGMSENNFRECVEFINNAEVSDDTKRFFEIAIFPLTFFKAPFFKFFSLYFWN